MSFTDSTISVRFFQVDILSAYKFSCFTLKNKTEYTYFKHGTLSRSPSDELLLVDGWDWGTMDWGLEPVPGVGKGGTCSPSGDSISFISYNRRTSSICNIKLKTTTKPVNSVFQKIHELNEVQPKLLVLKVTSRTSPSF